MVLFAFLRESSELSRRVLRQDGGNGKEVTSDDTRAVGRAEKSAGKNGGQALKRAFTGLGWGAESFRKALGERTQKR